MIGDWLLCDFHVHTTCSDGAVELETVVDLYGQNGFDVIAITDHILDAKTEEESIRTGIYNSVTRDNFSEYMHKLWTQAKRAWAEYNMLLIPSAEVTNNTNGFHILGIDLKEYIDPDLPVEKIVAEIHRQGGIAIAPHPNRGTLDGTNELMYLWDNHERFAGLFDAWEVANRDDLFNVVGLKKFNYIANSDFHLPRHLYSWKTQLHCEKNTEAIKEAIRKNIGVSVYLFRQDKHL